MNPLYSFLSEITVKGICLAENSRKPISVWSDDTVEDVVKSLRSNLILAAPVMDPHSKRCIAMVDFLDVVTFIVRVSPDPVAVKANTIRSLEVTGKTIAYQSLKTVADISGCNPYVPIKSNHKASHLIDLFAKGLRRAIVVDDNNIFQMEGVITEFSMINFLKNHCAQGQLVEMGTLSLQELDLIRKHVHVVQPNELVVDVLEVLQTEMINAVALIDKKGKLIGNFSCFDIHGLFKDPYPHLYSPVEDYLRRHNPESLRPVYCRLEACLNDIMHLMSNEHVHQVWVVDSSLKLVGVVSIKDIIKKIATFDMHKGKHA